MIRLSHRWIDRVWLLSIGIFAALHALHLTADFPNHTPWSCDWAKYTDEGWYGNAAIRAHLFGNWYVPGDFNLAPAVPVWSFLEWILFFGTGVTLQAARGLSVAFFFLNLLLSYTLVRSRGPRWAALLALTLLVTSDFLYCFGRLAVLEPMLTTLTLAAMNLALRLPRMRRPSLAATGIGLLFAAMMLSKTTAIFLLPALGWMLLSPLWTSDPSTKNSDPESLAAVSAARKATRQRVFRAVLVAGATSAAVFGSWMLLVFRLGLYADYKYMFFVNAYQKPPEFYWPLWSLWWALRGLFWIDQIQNPYLYHVHLMVPPALALFAGCVWARKRPWARALWQDPVFMASALAVAGYLFFMTYQNHPQPRYYALVAVFLILLLARIVAQLVGQTGTLRRVGQVSVAILVASLVIEGLWTLGYAAHPEYTFVTAANHVADYIDQHPNGNRLLVTISSDQISFVTHLPTLCDDFGTMDLVSKLKKYQPGWYATWNDLDPGTLEDLHNHYSLEQVASYPALDDPERNLLVLFKLHPLPNGTTRDPAKQNLQIALPGDKIDIPVE